ncbi:RsmF rRNA methyltransferase first C-terminal domain-containing protein [Paenibacillus sp.]|jgi:NOL1/NOP2/sun family putative RNA methylase|uniref:RsmF rRNA methyltransferase first C-terminal domain-containing protein n=1 Tax=Paenibacillus sp. TaxID=58172 RepID=UPI0028348167|nr:RsmF rRNA methyltransferase first C-terminal domain-containing protein [Paenibacillus sp.]MDR0270646.1 RsmF rRNA methyltransferase first C-terminal domain-containing protein [Paenibacillus sp.]
MGKETLPSAYIEQMKPMLGGDLPAFLYSYDLARTQGLRFNGLKTSPELEKSVISMFDLKPVPWCPSGYYYTEATRPGKHPYHQAGLYYIQEPSAMSAVELLDPQPGETILDLAAAPGGKSTHIASKMNGQGLLISNEIHPERAKILAENVERMGISNALVTCASPDELSRRFLKAFDRIMLDAPCSGEGMFRKDPKALEEWSPSMVDMCAARQRDILDHAYLMLKPGGTMAYSTCTFNRSENEDMMEYFTRSYPDMEIAVMKRLWPHQEDGEGHFVAVLRKKENTDPAEAGKRSRKQQDKGKNKTEQAALRDFEAWSAEELPGFSLPVGTPVLFGESLYLLPSSEPLNISGLKIPRAGLHLAYLKKNRIEPAHALAMTLKPEHAKQHIRLEVDNPQAQSYLRGETLPVDFSLRGWTLVTVDGLPIGWGKASGGQLKNHLPKGLRLF